MLSFLERFQFRTFSHVHVRTTDTEKETIYWGQKRVENR